MTSIEKIRQLRELSQKEEVVADLNVAAKSMGEVIGADIYLLGKESQIVASSTKDSKNQAFELNPDFQQRMAFIFQPTVNLSLETSLFKDAKANQGLVLTVYPLVIAGERCGNLLMTRKGKNFSDDELSVVEMGALLAAVLLSGVGTDKKGKEGQQKTTAQVALGSLSYSELEAIRNVFTELGGEEGFLVASKVADRIGITRSVIVNAMRKLESAGVVESRSLGMKGTYIRVKNPYFLSELSSRER